MRSRIARVAVLTLAALGLVATMAPPASATTVKLIAFTGQAVLNGGLGYPCTPLSSPPKTCPPTFTTTAKVDGKNTTVNFSGGNHRTFTFNTTVCAKLSATGKVATVPGKTGGALCTIAASGTVWGWCGLSGGAATATITNLGVPPLVPSNKTATSMPVKFIGVGGTLYVTGGNQNTNVHAVVVAIPLPDTATPVGGASCATKTGNVFQLTGIALYKDLTV